MILAYARFCYLRINIATIEQNIAAIAGLDVKRIA
jgi:hypothetical protein